MQQGRLAAAARTHDGDGLTGGEREVYATEGGDPVGPTRAVGLDEITGHQALLVGTLVRTLVGTGRRGVLHGSTVSTAGVRPDPPDVAT
ncbi:hypothetical protein GCM10025862_08220 [Arsenicicoccus piscis]|uniref:Uncharacterized protein n=1 Tax=Arsenicicoccus piscis TaxID=673954 RepID=A0ABQ6HK14_9MICO|nr:hypothetical protein GCM10025862_08220 [Arsenicicoccus piscis]